MKARNRVGSIRSLSGMLALRYLRSSRSGALISLLSGMTSWGLGVGVAALILTLAVLSGFQANLLEDELSRAPQLVIEASDEDLLREIQARVGSYEDVRSVQRLHRGRGWLVDSDEFRPVEMIAYEVSIPAWFPEPDRSGFGPPESVPMEGVWISRRRARAWALQPGDRIQLVSPRATLTPLGRPIPMRRQLEIAGTWSEARDPEVERVAGPFELLGPLVDRAGGSLDIELVDLASADRTARDIRSDINQIAPGSEVVVKTWRDLNVGLLFVLRLEKALVFVAVFLIVMVASFALISALALIMSSKQSELGVLSAMGARPRALRRSFFQLGMLLAVTGAGRGAAIGLSLALVLDYFRVIQLPQGIYIVDYLPFLVRSIDLTIVLVACLAFTSLSSMWAARRVAQLDPVEAMRR